MRVCSPSRDRSTGVRQAVPSHAIGCISEEWLGPFDSDEVRIRAPGTLLDQKSPLAASKFQFKWSIRICEENTRIDFMRFTMHDLAHLESPTIDVLGTFSGQTMTHGFVSAFCSVGPTISSIQSATAIIALGSTVARIRSDDRVFWASDGCKR